MASQVFLSVLPITSSFVVIVSLLCLLWGIFKFLTGTSKEEEIRGALYMWTGFIYGMVGIIVLFAAFELRSLIGFNIYLLDRISQVIFVSISFFHSYVCKKAAQENSSAS